MATIQGTGGGATFPEYNIKFSSWSANLLFEDVETSGFTDGGFRTFENTIVSINGSATGTVQRDASDTMPLPLAAATLTSLAALASASPISIVLTASTGNTFAFSGVVSNVAFTRPVDGKMDATLNFESSGAITLTWS